MHVKERIYKRDIPYSQGGKTSLKNHKTAKGHTEVSGDLLLFLLYLLSVGKSLPYVEGSEGLSATEF